MKVWRITNLFIPKLSKERRQTKVFVPQLSKERNKPKYLFLNYGKNEDEAKYFFLNYRRNEDEAKVLSLNYRRNEDEAKSSFLNYQRNEDKAKYSFLNYWWFATASCVKQSVLSFSCPCEVNTAAKWRVKVETWIRPQLRTLSIFCDIKKNVSDSENNVIL
jgi:hypothetical protein